MRQEIISEHRVDDKDLPAGGTTTGIGIAIEWQAGPIPNPERLKGPMTSLAEDVGANGAFVEGLIEAVISRMNWYNEVSDGKFRCRENAIVITKLDEALHWCDARAVARAKRGVLGTHQE